MKSKIIADTHKLKRIKARKNNQSRKKITVKEAVDKVIDTIKKPFAKKHKQKDAQEDAQLQVAQEKTQDNQAQQQQQPKHESAYERRQRLAKIPDVPFAENVSVQQASKLFYSNDRFIDTCDDYSIYETISASYKGLLASEHNEQVKRNAIVDMLNDVQYVDSILKTYGISILELFGFLFRLCPSVFKGLFIKKVQNIIKNKPYAKQYKISTRKTKQQKKLSRKYSIF